MGMVHAKGPGQRLSSHAIDVVVQRRMHRAQHPRNRHAAQLDASPAAGPAGNWECSPDHSLDSVNDLLLLNDWLHIPRFPSRRQDSETLYMLHALAADPDLHETKRFRHQTMT